MNRILEKEIRQHLEGLTAQVLAMKPTAQREKTQPMEIILQQTKVIQNVETYKETAMKTLLSHRYQKGNRNLIKSRRRRNRKMKIRMHLKTARAQSPPQEM